jgi:hypothetical protein
VVIFAGKNPLPLVASANDMIQRPLILSFNGHESDLTDFSLSLSLTLSPRSVSRLTNPKRCSRVDQK